MCINAAMLAGITVARSCHTMKESEGMETELPKYDQDCFHSVYIHGDQYS